MTAQMLLRTGNPIWIEARDAPAAILERYPPSRVRKTLGIFALIRQLFWN